MLAKGAMSMRHKFQMRNKNYQNSETCRKNGTGLLNIAHFSPNVLYGVHKDHTFAIVLSPQGQKTSIERIVLYQADEKMLSADYALMRAKNAAMWKEVFREDIEVLEDMEAGLVA